VIFRDREHAGRLLAERLGEYRGKNPLVLAVPRGAVVMGKVIADTLDGDLDVVLVHKLGAPGEPELAIGAVDEEGRVYLDETAGELGVDQSYIRRETEAQIRMLRARRALYTPARPPLSPAGRQVIVVDDGIATGASMLVALGAVRRRGPAGLVAATAVMPPPTLARIQEAADRVVCLAFPTDFRAVGEFFQDFSQVADGEVVSFLRAGAARRRADSAREGGPGAP
jgi:predicted phosphoribosyltransferase